MKKEVFFGESDEEKPLVMDFPCYYKSILEYEGGKDVNYHVFRDVDQAEVLAVSMDDDNGELSFVYSKDSDGPQEYEREFFEKETKIMGDEFNKMMNLYQTVIKKIKGA